MLQNYHCFKRFLFYHSLHLSSKQANTITLSIELLFIKNLKMYHSTEIYFHTHFKHTVFRPAMASWLILNRDRHSILYIKIDVDNYINNLIAQFQENFNIT